MMMLSQEILNACQLTTLTRNVVVKMDGSMNSIRKSLRKTIIESRNSDSQVAWTGGNADKYRSGTQNYIKDVFIGLNKLLDNNAIALQRFQREAWKIHQEAVRAEALIFNLREELTFLRRQRNGSIGISESIQNGIQQTSRQLADLQNRWNALVAGNVAQLKTESGKIRHLAGAILEMPSISSDLSLTTPFANISTETSSNNLNKRTLDALKKLQTNIDLINGDYQNDYATEWFKRKRTESESWRFGKGRSANYNKDARNRARVRGLDTITAQKLGLLALQQYVTGAHFKNLPCCAQKLIEGTFGLYGNPYPDVEENKIKGSKNDNVPNDKDVTQMDCSLFVATAAKNAGLKDLITAGSSDIAKVSRKQMKGWQGNAETNETTKELTVQGLASLVRPGMIITRYKSRPDDATGHTAIIVGITKNNTYLIAQADGRGGVTAIEEMTIIELHGKFHAGKTYTGDNGGPVLWDPAIACEANPKMAGKIGC